jgi:copper chaperone CopZ
MAQTEDITLNVPDVSCEHCVRAVYGAIGALPGVADVHTDLDRKTVSLRLDSSQTPLSVIEEKLDDAGYTVQKA